MSDLSQEQNKNQSDGNLPAVKLGGGQGIAQPQPMMSASHVGAAAPPLGGYNPQHTSVGRVPQHTPTSVRLFITAMYARYGLRFIPKSLTDAAAPEWTKHAYELHTKSVANKLYKEANELLKQKDWAKEIFPNGSIPDNREVLWQQFRDQAKRKGSPAAELEVKLKNILRPQGAAGDFSNLIQYTFGDTKGKELTEISHERIHGQVRKGMFDLMYTNLLGVGSLGMVTLLRNRALHDIKSLYTEAVAYELDKDPSQVTKDDIFNSHNEIIEDTSRIFSKKQKIRYGISLMPFLKNVPKFRWLHMDEAAIGAWGLHWAQNIWGRSPTMLENFSYFVNDKLNPLYGLGDHIRASDIMNFYQQYTDKFHPDQKFSSLTATNRGEYEAWARSAKVFEQVAALMNESYNYKHFVKASDVGGDLKAPADFQLPKFIFLLGHNCLNVRRPEWSMAYVQIANEYGIPHVKNVMNMERSGVSLKEVLQQYPVDLNPVNMDQVERRYQKYTSAPSESKAITPKVAVQEATAKDIAHQEPKHQISVVDLAKDNVSRMVNAQHERGRGAQPA